MKRKYTSNINLKEAMNKSSTPLLLLISVVSLFSFLASASDPDPAQDFCVSVNDPSNAVFVNGMLCKDPRNVTAADFYYAGGLHRPQAITSPLGAKIFPSFEPQLPGLNTQGLGMARLDIAPRGLNPPHTHPRATEMILVLKGTLYTGFISSNPPNPNDNNTFYGKILHPGDTFVYPRSHIHFQFNIGNQSAAAIACFNSQNAGLVSLGKAPFGSDPPLYPPLLAGGFQIDDNFVHYLQSLAWIDIS